MITVHHLENSRSLRVIWLLEELGIPYELKTYARDSKSNLAPPEYRALHPLGKSPLVTDGDRVLAETGAILEHLLEGYGDGRFQPEPGSPHRFAYRYWLHAAEGSFMPLLVMRLMFDQLQSRSPFFIRPIIKLALDQVRALYLEPSLKSMLDYMDSELAKSRWCAGEHLTLADIQLAYPLLALERGGDVLAPYPHLKKFLGNVTARPGFQAAIEKGGELKPFD